jgi:hypothetical protein
MKKSWFVNFNRLQELLSTKELREKIDTVLSYKNKETAQFVLLGWCIVLFCTFSLILTVRLALSIPLF